MSDQDNTSPLILFVDDETTAVKYFQRAINALAPVITAGNVEEGKRLLDAHANTLAVLVSDQRMPGGYGNELLSYARIHYPHMLRILTTAYSELEHTVEAVNQGQIHRYIQKPWEIAALRIEMKQALELAALRKEHAELLREKMLVRQKQTLSNRIASLHTLCASLSGPDNLAPLQNYLEAVTMVGCKPSQTDWLSMDYAELLSAEALRSGQLGYDLFNCVAEMWQKYQGREGSEGLKLLAELLSEQSPASNNDTLTFPNSRLFSEFLGSPCNVAISPAHINWLAFLLWLHSAGYALQFTRLDAGIECRLTQTSHVSPNRLTAWIEQFCED